MPAGYRMLRNAELLSVFDDDDNDEHDNHYSNVSYQDDEQQQLDRQKRRVVLTSPVSGNCTLPVDLKQQKAAQMECQTFITGTPTSGSKQNVQMAANGQDLGQLGKDRAAGNSKLGPFQFMAHLIANLLVVSVRLPDKSSSSSSASTGELKSRQVPVSGKPTNLVQANGLKAITSEPIHLACPKPEMDDDESIPRVSLTKRLLNWRRTKKSSEKKEAADKGQDALLDHQAGQAAGSDRGPKSGQPSQGSTNFVVVPVGVVVGELARQPAARLIAIASQDDSESLGGSTPNAAPKVVTLLTNEIDLEDQRALIGQLGYPQKGNIESSATPFSDHQQQQHQQPEVENSSIQQRHYQQSNTTTSWSNSARRWAQRLAYTNRRQCSVSSSAGSSSGFSTQTNCTQLTANQQHPELVQVHLGGGSSPEAEELVVGGREISSSQCSSIVTTSSTSASPDSLSQQQQQQPHKLNQKQQASGNRKGRRRTLCQQDSRSSMMNNIKHTGSALLKSTRFHRSHTIDRGVLEEGNHNEFLVVKDLTAKKQQMDSRRQVVVMLAFVVVCFFLLFLPYRLFTVWLIMSTEDQVQSLGMETYYNLTYFSRILIYLHSAINPIAYNLISTKFRSAFMSILFCRGPASRRQYSTMAASDPHQRPYAKHPRHRAIPLERSTLSSSQLVNAPVAAATSDQLVNTSTISGAALDHRQQQHNPTGSRANQSNGSGGGRRRASAVMQIHSNFQSYENDVQFQLAKSWQMY